MSETARLAEALAASHWKRSGLDVKGKGTESSTHFRTNLKYQSFGGHVRPSLVGARVWIESKPEHISCNSGARLGSNFKYTNHYNYM